MVKRSSIKNHVMTTLVAVLAVGLLMLPMQVQARQVSPGEQSVAVQPPVQTQTSTPSACNCEKTETMNAITMPQLSPWYSDEIWSVRDQPLNSPPKWICIGWGCLYCLVYGGCSGKGAMWWDQGVRW